MLDRYLGRDYIRAELYRVGALSTEYWIPNTTTPEDVLLVLEKISDPAYTNPDLSAEMLDIMTNTSFEDRLPQPLPEGTRSRTRSATTEPPLPTPALSSRRRATPETPISWS
jgi:beta-lactamase class A